MPRPVAEFEIVELKANDAAEGGTLKTLNVNKRNQNDLFDICKKG